VLTLAEPGFSPAALPCGRMQVFAAKHDATPTFRLDRFGHLGVAALERRSRHRRLRARTARRPPANAGIASGHQRGPTSFGSFNES